MQNSPCPFHDRDAERLAQLVADLELANDELRAELQAARFGTVDRDTPVRLLPRRPPVRRPCLPAGRPSLNPRLLRANRSLGNRVIELERELRAVRAGKTMALSLLNGKAYQRALETAERDMRSAIW